MLRGRVPSYRTTLDSRFEPFGQRRSKRAAQCGWAIQPNCSWVLGETPSGSTGEVAYYQQSCPDPVMFSEEVAIVEKRVANNAWQAGRGINDEALQTKLG